MVTERKGQLSNDQIDENENFSKLHLFHFSKQKKKHILTGGARVEGLINQHWHYHNQTWRINITADFLILP